MESHIIIEEDDPPGQGSLHQRRRVHPAEQGGRPQEANAALQRGQQVNQKAPRQGLQRRPHPLPQGAAAGAKAQHGVARSPRQRVRVSQHRVPADLPRGPAGY